MKPMTFHDTLTPAPHPTAGIESDVLKKVSKEMNQTAERRGTVTQMEANDDIATMDLEVLAKNLGTHLEKGMTSSAAAQRAAAEGPNELKKPPVPGLLLLFVMQLTNLIIMLLSASAVASIIVNASGSRSDEAISYVEGIAIFVIVILNAGIAAWTENAANSALAALAKMSQPTSSVVRDGKLLENPPLDSTAIVRGDIVLLQVGDIVPADMRLIESSELKVNEMLLTGEPDDVAKSFKIKKSAKHGGEAKLTPDSMVFSSCQVTNGSARGVITSIGMNTRVGEIAGMLLGKEKKSMGCLPDTSDSQTPLQVSLQKLGEKIGFMAIRICATVFLIGTFVTETRDPMDPSKPPWLVMILISVTLAVAAIPEGIPLCVTISLSKGCDSMVKENVLVRRLAAVETLGSASVVCTDKTGTLTEGKMTMVKMFTANKLFEVSGKGFDPTIGGVSLDGKDMKSDPTVRSTLLSAALCCNTRLVKEYDEALKDEFWRPKGNSSEAPIVVAAAKVGFWEDKLAGEFPRSLEVPFSSSRKMMMTCSKMDRATLGDGGVSLPEGTKLLAVVKGAPNYIIDSCTTWLTPEGTEAKLTEEVKASTMQVIDDLSGQALRVLAVAVKPMPKFPFDEKDEDLSSDDKFKAILNTGLHFMGLVASIDPERDGVKQAVKDANAGNIRVVMITGDYLMTAKAIAHNIRILKNAAEAREEGMEADDDNVAALDCGRLRPNGDYLSESGIDALTNRTKVFARAKPEDKLEIVKSLQRQGLVCAMTGDGVNDAPALNKADIGVAMGIQGTEVAKGASDMVLTDDNFCSIVQAVEKGRVIYAGIQKFVAFIMSVHIGEVLQIFACICADIPSMRTPLQILFLILVTDLPPAIALGMEPGQPGIMRDRPRPKKQPVMLMWMWQSTIVNGLILTVTVILCYIIALNHYVGDVFQDAVSARIAAEKFSNLSELPDYDVCRTTSDGADRGYDSCLAPDLGDDSLAGLGVGCEWNGYICMGKTAYQLVQARTTAFICVVWAENLRAYSSRTFDRPVFENTFSNVAMQKAITLAQIALYLVIFLPGLSYPIFELQGALVLDWGMWVGIGIAWLCIFLCELYKFVCKEQIKNFRERVKKHA